MKRGLMRRQGAAWILLAVFVPMLLLASLHRHAGVEPMPEESCYACAHHLHHAGHLAAMDHKPAACVLCQFLSIPYLAPATVTVAVVTLVVFLALPCLPSRLAAKPHGIPSLRAPPTCCL